MRTTVFLTLALSIGVCGAACGSSEEKAAPSPTHAATSHAAPPTTAAQEHTAAPAHHPSASAQPEPAANTATKEAATPFFWQRDPAAEFPNGGADYCAPVSLSSGLLYLTKARGLTGVAGATDEKAQIALVKELAKDLATDPKEGTNADQVLTGIERFAKAKGLTVQRLEVATWRTLSKPNEGHRVAQKPDLEWIHSAVGDRDAIVLANVGWYKKDPKGFVRDGGHWVDVVASGPQPTDLHIRNSLLKAEDQKTKTQVTLTKLDKFERVDGKTTTSMAGYYKVDGPALPFGGSTAAAVLDCVVVFTAKK